MMRYALESELYRGSTPAISIELPKERNVCFRALPRLRSFTANRLSMDQSLQREWTRRAAKPEQQASQLLPRDSGGSRERDIGTARQTSFVGSEEAQGQAGATGFE